MAGEPSANNLVHTDTAGQWSRQGTFDCIPGISFDFNVDWIT